MKVIMSSPKGTDKEDILFVIEDKQRGRIKMRLVDIDVQRSKLEKKDVKGKDFLNEVEAKMIKLTKKIK